MDSGGGSKICLDCKLSKLISHFNKNKRKPDGLDIYCKECNNARNKSYYNKNKNKVLKRTKVRTDTIAKQEAETIPSHKKCSKCQIDKLIHEFGYYSRSRDKHRTWCKVCVNAFENETKRRKRKQFLRKKRIENDINFRIREHIRSSIKTSLKSKGIKWSISLTKMIGNDFLYTLEELRNHIESLWEPWMSWDNWGPYKSDEWDDNDYTTWTWQIDHIIPQHKLIYKSVDDENFKRCWSLSNLRPLSAKQNILDAKRR